ncbi:hypothetical protein Avbf_00448 [Armadillidium vulgare]|nr:hypothetical protein Avbf_00448 [Armadillidium vulgare]
MIFNNIPITSTYQALAYLPHLQLRSIKIAGGPSQPTIKSNGVIKKTSDFLCYLISVHHYNTVTLCG